MSENSTLAEPYLQEIRNSNKIWKHLPTRILNSSKHIIPAPVSIEIQPTSACNLRCKWCSYWERNDFSSNKSIYMPFSIMENILEFIKLNNVKSVYLAGGGEPCAYPFIRETVKRLKELGVSIGLITNGTLFTRRLLDISPYFSYLQVSLISPNEKEYANVTGSDKGYNSMKELPSLIKNMHGDQSPMIGGMYVLTQWNYHETFKVVDFCKEQGFDYCSFRIAIDFEDRGVALPESIFDFLQEGMRTQKSFDNNFTNLETVLKNFNKSDYEVTSCVNIKYGLYSIVDPKGRIFICVPDVGKDERCLGNLTEDSFENIWNSERHHEVVKGLEERYCLKECHSACRSHGYNKVAKLPEPKYIPRIHSEFL